MAKNKRRKKSKIWGIVGTLVFLIQLICSAGFAYLIKDLLPKEYWVIAICVLLIFLGVTALIFAGLAKRIKKKNKGKILTVFFWILSLAFSAGLVYGSSVVDQGLNVLDEVADVTYQTHVMSVMVSTGGSYEHIQELDGKNVGILGMDEELTQKTLDEIKTKENVTMLSQSYDSVIDVYNAVTAGEVDAMLINDAYIMVVEEIIPDYSNNIRTIYQIEIQEEVKLSDIEENEGDIWDEDWDTDEEETKLPELIYPEEVDTDAEPTAEPTPEPAKRTEDPVVTKDTFNIFISGIDTYGSVSTVSRSDVNMIVTVNPTTKQILMTSIPRDYYVVLASKGAYDKLTHAGMYGVKESVRTLENLFGIQIDYYVKVNFTSLIKIVNAVGGITVNNPAAFTSLHTNTYYPTGNINMDGEMALEFVRERYALAGGDNDRVKNQQRVLTALIKKAISPSIIKNYGNVMSAISGSFVTNMSSDEIQSLIQMQLRDMSSWDIEQISVTGTNSSSSNCYSMKGYSVYVMKPNYSSVKSAASKINALF